MPQVSANSSLEPRLSIGAVAKATGLSPDTLRVWQKR
jgi:transposase-like protein